ncbi:MAG TPA: WXG100 family type VII secretion target [Microthrixaceae bacterium]|nr:WXG100 family type VII secretion target [Microthrixaceae bacterium]HNI34645.1 WXG100 family type VII secretion target [Microthrixaceae bacterium]
MAQLGADVEQLDRLGARFKEKAAEIDQMQAQISSQITGTWWQGGDADKFRGEWTGEMRGQLTKLKALLETTAATIARQAADQRAVSQS